MSNETGSGGGSGGGGGGGGLLSKMVKFVKSPNTHWADLDRPSEDRTSGHGSSESRLMLKEMIERKRRNDFVRNREFDLLRKLRRRSEGRNESTGVGAPPDVNGNISQYPSSNPPTDVGERDRTLKKIDEIEAQMATAWFKRKDKAEQTRQMPVTEVAAAPPPAAMTEHTVEPAALSESKKAPLEPVTVRAFAPTEPMENTKALAADLARVRAGHGPAHAPEAAAHAPADELAAHAPAQTPTPTPAPAHPMPSPTLPGFGVYGDLSEFKVEVVATARKDPEVEEAAIRFANGDAAGAEAGLRDLLDEANGSRKDDVETWLTMFDLFRASGQEAKFDEAALHFAARFGRSAPQWGKGGELASKPAPVATAAAVGRFNWVCPSTLNVASVTALNAALARAAQPWAIDWRYVKTVDPAALAALIDAFKNWASQPVRLKFLGIERLLDVLTSQSRTDDRTVDQNWWLACLALLRVLGEMDEFELVALNYCVTYEVSPPAWEDPKNSYLPMSAEGGDDAASASELEPDKHPSEFTPSFVPSDFGLATTLVDDGVMRAELSGELLGTATKAIEKAVTDTTAAIVELNCRHLLRVDFSAAGDLLNWALEQQRLERQVSFKQVNRMVAAFFGVIGITEAARVVLRTD